MKHSQHKGNSSEGVCMIGKRMAAVGFSPPFCYAAELPGRLSQAVG